MGVLHKSNIPPVTKEFIDCLKRAFPDKRPGPEASIGTVQRGYGQQDVIDWATQFMRTYDPKNPSA